MRGDDHRCGVVPGLVSCCEPFEQRGGRDVGSRKQQASVQVRTGLELHPGDLPMGEEDRRKAQTSGVLLDHLARGSGAREKARSQMRELRLKCRARYDSRVSGGYEISRDISGRVVCRRSCPRGLGAGFSGL